MGRLVLTSATLLDGERAPQPSMTVVVDGSRITAVGRGELGAAQTGDRVVDLAGRAVMPGMVTSHFHATYDNVGARPEPFGLEHPPAYQALVGARNLETALRCGFTGAVSAGAPHDIDASLKRAIEDGVVAGPRFVPGSRDVSTTGHANDAVPWHWDLRAWGPIRRCDGPDEFRKGVRDEIKRGAEIIKLFVTGGHGVTAPKERIEMTRDELRAAIDAAHSRGALIRGHIANKTALLMAVDAGIDVVDHGDELDHECIEAMVDAGTFLVPSVFFPRTFLDQVGRGLGFTDAMRAELEHMDKVLPEANEAGLRLLVGDDYGAMGLPHGSYGAELESYVSDVGIGSLDVIRWATKHGAELMRMGDRLGTIAEGKLADLLVIDGDPSNDISVLCDAAKLLAIVKNGELVKDALPSTAGH